MTTQYGVRDKKFNNVIICKGREHAEATVRLEPHRWTVVHRLVGDWEDDPAEEGA